MAPMFDKPLLSLRVRLAALVLIVVAPVVALVLATHAKYRRHDIDRAGANALQLARLASQHHDRLVDGARQLLEVLCRLPEVRDGDLTRCDATFAQVLHDNPMYESIVLVNIDGDIVGRAAPAAKKLNVNDPLWFQPVRDARGFAVVGYQTAAHEPETTRERLALKGRAWPPRMVSESSARIQSGRLSSHMVLICAQPLLDERGRPLRVVAASLRTEWLERFAEAANLPAGSTISLVGRDGIVRARHPDGAQWVGRTVPHAPVLREVVEAGVTEAPDVSGEARVCASAPLGASSVGSPGMPRSALYVVVSLPRRAVLASANRQVATELLGLALVTLVMLLIAWLVSRLWIFRWIDRLAAATRRVAAGELSARAELIGGPPAFRRLGESFDEMAAALEQAAAQDDFRRSGQHLRNVLNNLFTFVAVLTPDGILTEVNKAALKTICTKAGDVLGKPFEQTPWWANAPHEQTRLRDAIARAARGEVSRYDASPPIAPDAARIFIDMMVAPMFDDQQTVTHLVVSGIDVTEQRRAQQALRESEERLTLAMRAAGLGTWDEDVQTGKALWSQQTFRLLGYEPLPSGDGDGGSDDSGGEATVEMWRSRVHRDDLDRVTTIIATSMRERSLYNPEYRVVRGDGEIAWVSSAGRFVYEDGRAVRFIGVMQDITARKRAEEEIARLNQDLQRRVGELQALLEVLPVGIGIARDRACARIDVNAAFGRVLGLSSGDNASLGAPPGERPEHFTCWIGDRQLTADELPLQIAARTGEIVRDLEVEVRHRDGRVVHLLEYAAPLLDARGATRGSVGAFIDISERIKADAERETLMEQANAERAKLEAVLRQMPAGVVIAEAASGRIVLRNQQVACIWRHGVNGHDDRHGYESSGFHDDGRPYQPHEWPLARSIATGERVSGEEIEIERGDGTRGHISVNAGPILDGNGRIVAGVATFYDITERKLAQSIARKQQAELIHLSRLSTMGQMAAGLAHELNQPLGAILNYAGVCLDRVNAQDHADEKVVKALEEVAGETRRAGEIIRRLRGFARKEKPNVRPTAINHLVREAVAMVSAELHYAGVHLEFDLCESLPDALADGVQIEQVLVNLVRNAIDAMRDTEPALRRLTVRTESLHDVAARISVIDAGCGITPEVRTRIFDAFFTTKPDGLGMGLPICQSIVQGHGGNLDVTGNGNSGGTVVHFTLPLVQPEVLQ